MTMNNVIIERDQFGQYHAYCAGCSSDAQPSERLARVSLQAAINGKAAMHRPVVRLAEVE